MELNKRINDNGTKRNSNLLPFLRPKDAVGWTKRQWLGDGDFRVRRCALSLGFRPIGPAVLNGARRKVALRGEDYAWAAIWWSSDNSKR